MRIPKQISKFVVLSIFNSILPVANLSLIVLPWQWSSAVW